MPPPIDDRREADRLSRRSTLVRAGGLAAAALGAASLAGRGRRRARARGARSPACSSPEMTEGPYYLPRREAAPQHHARACRARRSRCA